MRENRLFSESRIFRFA